MKILINKDETYEIKFPETINAEGFMELLNQFDNIVKLIRLNSIQKEFDNNGNIKVKGVYNKSNKNPFLDTREKALDLLQYAYCGTKEDKQRIEKIMKRKWGEIVKPFYFLKTKYNIKPNEVGLIKFKLRDEKGKREDCRIPNYIIKSYTGIFDENGKENSDENEDMKYKDKAKKKTWTNENDIRLKEMLEQNLPRKEIAERLGVSLPILKYYIRKVRGLQ